MIERGVVMTELKMFSKPVVFTDFDGGAQRLSG